MDPMISLGQKNTLAEYMILSGADNRPPMLDKDLSYSFWPTVEENGVIRTKKYAELSATEKIQADCDMKATNIILQGLPADIYLLVNHHRVAKDLWERVQLLMQGTSLTKQKESLINVMNIYKMKMEQFQVNTKFLNSLPPEWSKFVTDVKLVKDLHTSNFDQLHAYLEQHELHANEVRIMRERNQDPLAFVANQQMTPPYFHTYQSYYNNPQLQQQFSPSQHGSIQPNQHFHLTLSITNAILTIHPYPPSIHLVLNVIIQTLTVSTSFVFPVFSPGDDPIACLNKAMAFLTAVASSRFPSTNNQLRTSSNPRNHATIQDGRVTVQQARVVKCYKLSKVMGYGYRQCTQPKPTKDAALVYKEKAMLAEAQEAGQILDEEQLAFLTEDLDTYDSDCDDLSTAQAVLMANISNYGSDIILEANKEQNNESITAELERYKERVKTFEQRLNIDLSSREKIDSQMDDMIREKLALKEQIDSLDAKSF
ncbi:hypothetical protein Tco_1073346 [Tanacetum coccineum]